MSDDGTRVGLALYNLLTPFTGLPVDKPALKALTVLFAAECVRAGVPLPDVIRHLSALYGVLSPPGDAP